jgi:hypothetical protein
MAAHLCIDDETQFWLSVKSAENENNARTNSLYQDILWMNTPGTKEIYPINSSQVPAPGKSQFHFMVLVQD